MARAITIEVKGVADAKRALGAAFAQIKRQVDVAVMDFATEIKEEVSYAIRSPPKTGVLYYRIFDPKTGLMTVYAGDPSNDRKVAVYRTGGKVNLSRTHQSSAPGQAPAADTGTLINSIYVEPQPNHSVIVGSRLAYAAYLEFGTRKISPRPSWVPAIEKLRPEFEAEIRRIVTGAANAKR